jgi:chromosome segregation ATPase
MTHPVASWWCLCDVNDFAGQGEPEFDRLKRELEEVKNQPRGLEGTFRTAAEMERHRAQLADQAIEEQLEVQTAFREHGSRLQVIYDKRQRTEIEMARREQEMKQLNGKHQKPSHGKSSAPVCFAWLTLLFRGLAEQSGSSLRHCV